MMQYQSLLRVIRLQFLTALALTACALAHAEWEKISTAFPSATVQSFARHSTDAKIWFAGVSGGVYKTNDSGATWRETLKLRSAQSEVRSIVQSSDPTGAIFALTDEGVYRSRDKGSRWERIFAGVKPEDRSVRSVAVSPSNASLILVGADSGLFVSKDGGAAWAEVAMYHGQSVHQIEWDGSEDRFWISAAGGVSHYDIKADQSAVLLPFRRVRADAASETAETNSSLIHSEEEPVHFAASPATHLFELGSEAGAHKWCAIRGDQAFQSLDGGVTWNSVSASFPEAINEARAIFDQKRSKVFFGTRDGVTLVDLDLGVSERVGGLPDPHTYALQYYQDEDALYAATAKGLFRLRHPEFVAAVSKNIGSVSEQVDALMGAFDHEPTVLELQQEAIRYAEVHPDKISNWRKAASRRAWIPKLSTGYDMGRDEVVDLDRGGTNDPDRFINGPEEIDRDLSVDLSWDLSELIWNGDQTSIDTRSKLMAELREEVLSQLNHLYYARRRLQILALVLPAHDLKEAIERAVQIEEYSAGLDALTGGYFSGRMGKCPLFPVMLSGQRMDV